MNIPIAHSAESLEQFLHHIATSPIPDAVTPGYLYDNGFTSGNATELRQIFRLLGFLDGNDRPRERWSEYCKVGQPILRTAVKECYADLFARYPTVSSDWPDDKLRAWFHPPTTGNSKSSIERAIRTFKKLSHLAGIDDLKIPEAEKMKDTVAQKAPVEVSVSPTSQQLPFVIQLPVLSDRAHYAEIFEAIKQVFM